MHVGNFGWAFHAVFCLPEKTMLGILRNIMLCNISVYLIRGSYFGRGPKESGRVPIDLAVTKFEMGMHDPGGSSVPTQWQCELVTS